MRWGGGSQGVGAQALSEIRYWASSSRTSPRQTVSLRRLLPSCDFRRSGGRAGWSSEPTGSRGHPRCVRDVQGVGVQGVSMSGSPVRGIQMEPPDSSQVAVSVSSSRLGPTQANPMI